MAARAQQQPATPVIGFLGSRAPGDDPHLLLMFRRGLEKTGYVEGKNVAIEISLRGGPIRSTAGFGG